MSHSRWSQALCLLMTACLVSACRDRVDSSPAKELPPPDAKATPSASLTTSAPTATMTSTPSGGSSSSAPVSSVALAPINTPASVTQKSPYVLFLHGLGASGKILADNLKLASLAADRKFSWSAPDGDLNSKGQRFWNASKACCNLDGTAVDHVSRLRAQLQAAAANDKVDPRRLYVVGWSNGGFLAHRLACEVEGIAAIVSIAGAGPAEGELCAPKGPVAVLQIHGDADETIRYEGGHALGRTSLPRHPAARDTVDAWASRVGCQGKPSSAGSVDLDDKLEGAETVVARYSGCARSVELWTVRGGNHYVGMGRRAQEAFLGFLEKQTLP